MNSLAEEMSAVLKDDLYVSDTSIADTLIENGTLSADAWQTIHMEPAKERKVNRLVRYLSTTGKPLEAFEQLAEALKRNHTHLVKPVKKVIEDFKQKESGYDSGNRIIHSAGLYGKVCKTNKHQIKFISKTLQEILKGDLYVHDCGLVDGLIAFGILDSSDWEIISSAKRNKRKTKKLIQCILKSRHPCLGLKKFRDLLAISHQHLQTKVDELLQTLPCAIYGVSSISSSDSEKVSDMSPSDLEPSEIYIFETLMAQHGYTSEAIDKIIEKGYLTSDDYNAVQDVKSDRHKAAVLTKLVIHKYNSVTECKLALREIVSFLNTEDELIQYPLPHVGIPNRKQVRNLEVIYDKLNFGLNEGTLDIKKVLVQSEMIENNDILCIVYYFKGMEKIFTGNFDDAEPIVEKIDNILEFSCNRDYLRGEVMSAKSWLLLKTQRLGRLETFLLENLQLVQTCPNIWSHTAMGWLYYELSRCNIAKLELIIFRNIGRKPCELKWCSAQNECIQSAKRYIYKAREYFNMSVTSDGPLGLGFCNCLLVDLLLKCGDSFRFHELECNVDDVHEAEEILNNMSKGADTIPPTLEADFLLCQCDLQFRKRNYSKALEIAKKCHKRSEEMQLAEEMENSQKRIKRLDEYARHRFDRQDNLLESFSN